MDSEWMCCNRKASKPEERETHWYWYTKYRSSCNHSSQSQSFIFTAFAWKHSALNHLVFFTAWCRSTGHLPRSGLLKDWTKVPPQPRTNAMAFMMHSFNTDVTMEVALYGNVYVLSRYCIFSYNRYRPGIDKDVVQKYISKTYQTAAITTSFAGKAMTPSTAFMGQSQAWSGSQPPTPSARCLKNLVEKYGDGVGTWMQISYEIVWASMSVIKCPWPKQAALLRISQPLFSIWEVNSKKTLWWPLAAGGQFYSKHHDGGPIERSTKNCASWRGGAGCAVWGWGFAFGWFQPIIEGYLM